QVAHPQKAHRVAHPGMPAVVPVRAGRGPAAGARLPGSDRGPSAPGTARPHLARPRRADPLDTRPVRPRDAPPARGAPGSGRRHPRDCDAAPRRGLGDGRPACRRRGDARTPDNRRMTMDERELATLVGLMVESVLEGGATLPGNAQIIVRPIFTWP